MVNTKIITILPTTLNPINITYLAERNYENLVQTLTNNAIDNAGASSSPNPTLSSPQ